MVNTKIRLITFLEALQSTKIRPGADCGSDHELLIAKFRLKLKKAGKMLIELCQENAPVIANTLLQQHEKTLHMDITIWSTTKSD